MIVPFEKISTIRERFPDKTIAFGSGCFDLLHPGHVLYLEDCRRHGDITVVEVACDANIRGYKRTGRPVLNEAMRIKLVDSLKCVDYCFLDPVAKDGNLLAVLHAIFRGLRPNTFINNDDAFGIPERRAIAAIYGVGIVVLERRCPSEFENISTTGILRKIKESDIV